MTNVELIPLYLNQIMPKKSNNLIDQITSFENIQLAYEKCKKGKRYSFNCLEFSQNLERNLIDIEYQLINNIWLPGTAKTFTVSDPKVREICAPPFKDRIVHHAVMNICAPIFEKRFIHNSYACRVGKGVQAATVKLQEYLREPKVEYYVKTDVKKCFNSLRHDQLLSAVSRIISCKPTLKLFETIFQAYGNVDMGLPIGALTSQWACNLILTKLDHAMTSKHGYGKYIRYMDDVILLVDSKSAAHECLKIFEEELNSLGLVLNPKSGIGPKRKGVTFVGYKTYATHILPHKRTLNRAKKQLTKFPINSQRIDSFISYAKHCDSYRSSKSIFHKIILGEPNGPY